jgi:hypothetical protein
MATRRTTEPTAVTNTQFNDLTRSIPFAPTSEYAKGLLAPLVRATGHVLFLLAATASRTEAGPLILTPEEEKNELVHAAAHLDTAHFLEAVVPLSSGAKTNVVTFALLVNQARDNWDNWLPEDRPLCLRNLANAAAGLAAFLDRELTGLPAANSDPGSSL